MIVIADQFGNEDSQTETMDGQTQRQQITSAHNELGGLLGYIDGKLIKRAMEIPTELSKLRANFLPILMPNTVGEEGIPAF